MGSIITIDQSRTINLCLMNLANHTTTIILFGKAFETHTMQHILSKANCFHIIVAQVLSKKWQVNHFYVAIINALT
jgi:hypothetical protein